MSKEQIMESISNIELSKLKPFEDHPFSIRDDEAMQQTVESVREYGVLVPAIARPLEDGTYELISGHRRKHACELAGLTTMPVIVRNVDQNTATIIMVDSNLQRENILPSERAKAYKMKLEAIKRQGARNDLTSGQVGPKLESRRSNQIVADEAGESVKQIQRYIRLTELAPELQNMVDEGIAPYFRERRITLKELTAKDIQDFYLFKLKSVSASSVIHYHANIHKALNTQSSWI